VRQAVQRALRHRAEPDADPSDVIALVVLWRLRYKLSLRDLPEMFAMRGIVFSYEAVRDWEAKLTPALADDLRRRRRGKVGRSWYVDET
jgi:putative transposase